MSESSFAPLIFALLSFAVAGFFVFALMRAQKRRRDELSSPKPQPTLPAETQTRTAPQPSAATHTSPQPSEGKPSASTAEPTSTAARAETLKKAEAPTPGTAKIESLAEHAAKVAARAEAEAAEQAPSSKAKTSAAPAVPAPPAPKRAHDVALSRGLTRTKDGLLSKLSGLFGGGKAIPEDLLVRVEEVLLTSDVGVKTTTALLERLKERLSKNQLADEQALFGALEEEIGQLLGQRSREPWTLSNKRPFVILMVGVNGVGKTTTIGKLAGKFRQDGLKVLVAAGDTFRAAAADQLKIWSERTGAEYYAGKANQDPASVVFEAIEQGKKSGVDVILCDTAGRLHTKANLMDELKKVKRVIGKVIPDAPHEIFLVVDGTTGQNAVAQAREFNEAMGLTGIVLTKLDGTAKGGVVVAIESELGLPIRFIGVGESVDDLRTFSPEDFASALFAAA